MGLLGWSPDEAIRFIQDYPGKVGEEFKGGLRALPQNRYLGAARMLSSPFSPFLDYAYKQAGGLLAPVVNQAGRSQQESTNRLLARLGYEPREYTPDVTGEQLTAPIALAAGILRGKVPPLMEGSWTSPAIKTILEVMKKRHKATPKQWRQEIVKGGGRRELAEIDVVYPGSGAVDPHGKPYTYSMNLEDFFKDDKSSIPAGEVLKKLHESKIPLQETVLKGENLKWWHGPANRVHNLRLEDEGNPQEILIQLPDSYPSYQDPHYAGYRNMILNIRINEGIVEGDKSLILQEVESTIHQRGASMRKEEVNRLMAKERISREEARKLVPVDWAYTIDDEGRMRLNDYPYKRTWHELGFKRALMEALKDPTIKRLVWPKGVVMVERAWEDWENNPVAVEGSKLLFDLHDKKLKRFNKRFLKKTPEEASSESAGEPYTIESIRRHYNFLGNAQQTEEVRLERQNLKERLDEANDLWSIDLEGLRERFKVKIRGEYQIHVPLAQKEGGGLLGRYA